MDLLPRPIIRYLVREFLDNPKDVLNLRLCSKDYYFKLANIRPLNVKLVIKENECHLINPYLEFRGYFDKIIITLPEPVILDEENNMIDSDNYSCGFSDGGTFYSQTFVDMLSTFVSIKLKPEQLEETKKILYDYGKFLAADKIKND